MGRSRYGRRRSPPFRAWGLVLGIVWILLASKGLWAPATLVASILLFYLLLVRLTRCRVETTAHRPCRWLVRGFLGTCDYHAGYKRGLPVLIHGNGTFGLPMFMWRRVDFGVINLPPDPQPTVNVSSVSRRAGRPGYDWVMMALAGMGLLVAIAAFIRDLVAG